MLISVGGGQHCDTRRRALGYREGGHRRESSPFARCQLVRHANQIRMGVSRQGFCIDNVMTHGQPYRTCDPDTLAAKRPIRQCNSVVVRSSGGLYSSDDLGDDLGSLAASARRVRPVADDHTVGILEDRAHVDPGRG